MMIDGLKEILDIIKDMPELAVWVAAGFIFYKLAVWGSTTAAIVMVSKLAIDKLHDYKVTPKKVEHVWSLDDQFITSDGAYKEFLNLMRLIKKDGSSYVHQNDVQFLSEAFIEKKKMLEEKR